MTSLVKLPHAYVVARASIADGGLWIGELLRVSLRTLEDAGSIEVIDEEQTNTAGDIAGAVFKISEHLLPESFRRLSEDIQSSCPRGVHARLVKGVTAPEQGFPTEDLSIEYFKREFARDSRMVHHMDSCVRLTHLPTGSSARSTAHRSRTLNYEEALLLLASLQPLQNQ